MKDWPFLGGLITLTALIVRAIYRWLDAAGTAAERLLILFTFLALLSHILHQVGVPVPDLLPFFPSLFTGGGTGT